MININNKNYDTHVINTNNPHTVTKTQIGLGNVVNVNTILEGLKLKTPFELSNKVIASLFGSTSIFYAGQSLSKLKDILIKNTKK